MEDLLSESENEESINPLKYQSYIDSKRLHEPCPNCCLPMSATAYRFINSTFEWREQFVPAIVSDEMKKYNRHLKDEASNCIHCSLSLYTSQEIAISNYKFTNPKIRVKLDFVSIAAGELYSTDGVASKPDNKGHFSFYEYAGVDISNKFKVVKELI